MATNNQQLTFSGEDTKPRGSILSTGKGEIFSKPKSSPVEEEPQVNGPLFSASPVPKVPKSPASYAQLQGAWMRWSASQSPQDLQEVVRLAQPTIEKGITSYAGSDSSLIRSHAKLLAIQAIKGYKPTAKARLDSWLMTNLQGLNRYRQGSSPIKVPQRVQLELYRLKQAEQELRDELGRDPAPLELADHTGLSERRIARLRAFDKPMIAEGSLQDEEGAPYLPGTSATPWEEVWAQYVYHDLHPTDQKIYDMVMGRHGHPRSSVTQAAQLLHLTPSAVSQRARRIAQRLEEANQVRMEG